MNTDAIIDDTMRRLERGDVTRDQANQLIAAVDPAWGGADATTRLPILVQRAADALLSAKTHAEVLDAQGMANVAYTAAKTAGRMLRMKRAHDTLLAEVYRAQADALLVEAQARMMLANEYDAAQDRGEVAGHGGGRNFNVTNNDVETTAADLGIHREAIRQSRRLRDAETAEPGITERALGNIVDRGEEPTKAKLRREIAPAPTPKIMDPSALWLWGRLKDFERNGVLSSDSARLLNEMTAPMREDVARLTPLVRAFLKELETQA